MQSHHVKEHKHDVASHIVHQHVSQARRLKKNSEEAHPSYIDLISTFLFLALVNKRGKPQNLKVSDAHGALFRSIKEISGSAENCLFWSNNQYLMLEGENRRTKFDSGYGTGMF